MSNDQSFSNPARKKFCSIFFYEGYVSIAPTIINISKILESSGYLVTIFATQNEVPQPEKIGHSTKIRYFQKKFTIFDFLNKRGFSTLVKGLSIIVFTYQSLWEISTVKEESNQENRINIGVDFNGGMVALVCSYLFKQKFVFLSLEIGQPENLNRISKFFIKLFNTVYKNAEFIIIQDEDRLKTLNEYYQYEHPKVFYLPNSPMDEGNYEIKNNINFFREKFNLSEEKFPYIILQAGLLSDRSCSKSLAQAFASIDNGCALILHGVMSGGITEESPYIKSLGNLNSKNLFFSLTPVPYEELSKIYASSTIGLAFYGDCGDNFTKIAMASGKLAFYLRYSKPVLVSNFPSLKELIDQYQFGIAINDPSDPQEIQSAIEQILRDYDLYSRNAKACFDAEFNFAKKMEPILSSIESLLRS